MSRTSEQKVAFAAGRKDMRRMIRQWTNVVDDEKLDRELVGIEVPKKKWALNRLKAQLRESGADQSLDQQMCDPTTDEPLRTQLTQLRQDTSLTPMQKGVRVWNLKWDGASIAIR